MRKKNQLAESKYEDIKNKLELKNNLLKHIYEISSIMAGSFDLDEVLRQIVDRVTAGLLFDRAAILLLNEDETRIDCLCTKGFSKHGKKRAQERPIIINKHDCYESKVIKSGEPLFVEDMRHDPLATKIDKIISKHQERKSILYVPLKSKHKVFGMVGVDRYRTQMKITQDDVESLSIFANQASILIENAMFYKALYDEKMLSENIIASSITGIIVSNFQGKIQRLNRKAEEILGVNIEDLKDTSLRDLFDIDEAEKTRIVNVWKRKQAVTNLELYYNHKDEKRLLIGVKVFPLLDSSGKIQGLVTSISDITEKKKMDDHLLRLDKFAALGRIAAGIAHEIRNPLAAIYAIIQYLDTELHGNTHHMSCFEIITNEIGRIEKLIRQVLDLSMPLPLQEIKTNVPDLLLSIVMLVSQQASQKGITIKTEFESKDNILNVDPNRMKQVFLNLLINAMESIQGGGEILIRTRSEIDGNGLKKWMLIEVKDNGIGISAKVVDNIFDPFFTTKNVGTGLGLTVSHKIIQDHGGSIEVASIENEGTTFYVRLPIMAGDSMNIL